jgi:hypothetical protein
MKLPTGQSIQRLLDNIEAASVKGVRKSDLTLLQRKRSSSNDPSSDNPMETHYYLWSPKSPRVVTGPGYIFWEPEDVIMRPDMFPPHAHFLRSLLEELKEAA